MSNNQGADNGAQGLVEKLIVSARALGSLDCAVAAVELALEIIPMDDQVEAELMHLSLEIERVQELIANKLGIRWSDTEDEDEDQGREIA